MGADATTGRAVADSSLKRRVCPLEVLGDQIEPIAGGIRYNSPDSMPIHPGATLGPYEILSAIGAGGMGEVYKARDTRLNREVAIKVLAASFSDRSELRQRFEREAQAIAALNHPHICILYDVGRQDDLEYLVMEYLEGETLASRIAKGPIPLADAMTVAQQIAGALEKAHRHGLTHRDLKPGNIMLTASGAKLLDFGLAKLRAKETAGTPVSVSALPTDAKNLTADGSIIGTLQYMAPEQLEGKEADPRTDIFALGAVIYEMITGRKAFEGKSQVSLMAAILEHEPPSMAALQPVTPVSLDRVVQTCLAKDPDDRWQTAREVSRELKWVLQSAPAKEAMPAITRSPWRERIAWGIAAIAILLTGVIAIGPFRTKPDETAPVRFAVLPAAGTTFGGNTVAPFPAISPDGRRIVFQAVAAEAATTSLWVRSLDSMDALPLRGTEGASLAFWSPDSRFVGFFADGKLKKIDLAGGPPQSLSDTTATEGGTWNRDEVILLGNATGPLLRVSAAGGQPVPATSLDASANETSHRWPSFLPDGRHFLFVTGSPARHSSDRWIP